MNKDFFYMLEALKLARKCLKENEVPVGAVIVLNNKIISTGRNMREKEKNSLAHAEIKAIYKACKKIDSWRLINCEMFVTLEPCPMCAGAIINSRIKKVVFSAFDQKAGACGSITNLFDMPFNHKPEYKGGILEEKSKKLLINFFKKLR